MFNKKKHKWRLTVLLFFNHYSEKFTSGQHHFSAASINHPCEKFKNLINAQGASSDHYGSLKVVKFTVLFVAAFHFFLELFAFLRNWQLKNNVLHLRPKCFKKINKSATFLFQAKSFQLTMQKLFKESNVNFNVFFSVIVKLKDLSIFLNGVKNKIYWILKIIISLKSLLYPLFISGFFSN